MSLISAALLQDETVHGRLFVASNGFPIFALLKAIARRFARQLSKGRVPLSNVIGRCCVVRLFARHDRIIRCKMFPRGSE
jgi:hypothetical protein